FRSLKLWMVLRHFGAEGLRARIAEHMRLARLFAEWVDASDEFERLAPVPFSVVCFRSIPPALRDDDAALDSHNEQLVESVNRSGRIFLSHTRLNGRYCIRLAVGNLHTTSQHLADAWELLNNLR
ncbi:MAG: pyridoxal-dependent decarboxylase, partial [Vicinamibacterales bacterium]